MNKLAHSLLFAACCLPLSAFSAEISEDEILHATFVAFQEPGVFSKAYIAEKRQILQLAALEGNAIARLVVNQTGKSLREKAEESYVSLVDQY